MMDRDTHHDARGIGFIDIQWVETQVSNGVSSDGNDHNPLLLLMDFDLVDAFQQGFGNE
jgi:hypothetical protein